MRWSCCNRRGYRYWRCSYQRRRRCSNRSRVRRNRRRLRCRSNRRRHWPRSQTRCPLSQRSTYDSRGQHRRRSCRSSWLSLYGAKRTLHVQDSTTQVSSSRQPQTPPRGTTIAHATTCQACLPARRQWPTTQKHLDPTKLTRPQKKQRKLLLQHKQLQRQKQELQHHPRLGAWTSS